MSACSPPVLWPHNLAPLALATLATPWQLEHTGLIVAARDGHEAVVRLLLEHKADVVAVDQVP